MDIQCFKVCISVENVSIQTNIFCVTILRHPLETQRHIIHSMTLSNSGGSDPTSGGFGMQPNLDTSTIILGASMAGTCVLCAGIFSGLTLAFFSLDEMDLKIAIASGSETERLQAQKCLPIVRRHHFLLVTLLLCNAVVAEALPIFLNEIFTEVAAIAISVTAVLFFGEIIPQSLMAANALQIGALLSPLVWFLMFATSPISYPIALLLDKVVGAHSFELFGKRELREVIRMHSPQGALKSRRDGPGSRASAGPDSSKERHSQNRGSELPFGVEESRIVFGAMRLSEYTVKDCMKTFLDQCYMLSYDAILDKELINEIMTRGYSRIPVYHGADRFDIRGILIVKTLLCLCYETPSRPLTVGEVTLSNLHTISCMKYLKDAYSLFTTHELGTQFAIVLDEEVKPMGILTLEDVLETVLQVEITDETDLGHRYPVQVAARHWQFRHTLRQSVQPGSVSPTAKTRGASVYGSFSAAKLSEDGSEGKMKEPLLGSFPPPPLFIPEVANSAKK